MSSAAGGIAAAGRAAGVRGTRRTMADHRFVTRAQWRGRAAGLTSRLGKRCRLAQAGCGLAVAVDAVRSMTGIGQAQAGPARPPGGIAPQGLELRHLRYLVAVAEAGTFTDAAERMFIAQPT